MTYSKLLQNALVGAKATRTGRGALASTMRTSLLLLLIAACGFPRPPNVGDDVPADSPDPGVTIHVSPSGDDANDGLTRPVKTLKRAIAIAGTNTDLTAIVLEVGRYTAATGETFPYAVPGNVTIAGQASGGSVLAGTKTEAALTVDSGKLRDLEFEDFDVVVAATGTTELTNVQVRTSHLAVRGTAAAKLTIDNLEITGAVDVCGRGVELSNSANLMANNLKGTNLSTALKISDTSTADIAKANIDGDPRCPGVAVSVTTTGTLSFHDSSIVDGFYGIQILGTQALPSKVTLTNTALRNLGNALGGASVILMMSGGEISDNVDGVPDARNGNWTFTDVSFRRNSKYALGYVSGTDMQNPAILTMRRCTVADNGGGVVMFDWSAGDLGTDANPGNNIFQNNGNGTGLSTGGIAGPQLVNAVGNTWNPGIQNADLNGRYVPSATISGPVSYVAGNNYQISDSGLNIRR